MKKLACGLGVATILAASSALAKEPGTIAVGGSVSIGASRFEGNATGTSNGGGGGGLVSVDVFVGSGLTVGLVAEASYHKWKSERFDGTSSESRNMFVVPGLQVGYYVPLGDHAAFWPVVRASYGFGRDYTKDSNGSEQGPSATVVSLSAEPQVMWLPTDRFFLRFTPMSFSYRSTRWKDQGVSAGYLLGSSFSPSVGMGVVF